MSPSAVPTASSPRPRAREIAGLAGFVLATFGAGAIGGLATETGPGSWYATLEQPAWNPPDWLFAPVWTVLYVLIAVSAWLVWRRAGRAARRPLALWAVQLALNAGWSLVFFGLQRPGWALVEIVVLAAVIVALIAWFARWSRAAAWMLVPYLAWVGFATALNAAIWQLD